MFSLLNKPYPYTPFTRRYIRNNFFLGVFIFLFLYLFQPFGISEWQTGHKQLKLLAFGMISFIMPVVLKWAGSLFFSDEARQDSWKVWKEVLNIIVAIFLIAAANLIFAWSIGLAFINGKGLLSALIVTGLIGVFPIALSVLIKYNQFLSMNVKEAEEIETEIVRLEEKSEKQNKPAYSDTSQLIFTADNEKDKLGLFPDQLLYIESADNYSTVVFLQGELKNKEMLRSSLKRIEGQIRQNYIVRCHRSYIVNLKNISHIEGNAQGYRVWFKNADDTIPVSRNYGRDILEQFRNMKSL